MTPTQPNEYARIVRDKALILRAKQQFQADAELCDEILTALDAWEKQWQEQQRWRDLVRSQRMELLELALITEDEYAALAEDHPAVDRLESYDMATEHITSLERQLRILRGQEATNE